MAKNGKNRSQAEPEHFPLIAVMEIIDEIHRMNRPICPSGHQAFRYFFISFQVTFDLKLGPAMSVDKAAHQSMCVGANLFNLG
jgi:hypothetical protein